jgi:glycosyltransferase involved in cell wall biosynthesis
MKLDSASSLPKRTVKIWINARFLTRRITGVERVAHEILRALAKNYLTPTGCYQAQGVNLVFAWALPNDFADDLPAYGKDWDRQWVGTLRGHAWEQYDLAKFSPQDWLLNLCNTAPLFRRKQAVFFHDAQAFALPQNFDWKFRLWYKCLLHVAGRRAQVLFTNSYFSQSELAKYTGIAKDRFVVTHLGVDHMADIEPTLPTAIEPSQEATYVLAVSSASPNKNFAGVIAALADLQGNAHVGLAIPKLLIAGQTYSKVFQDSVVDRSACTELGYVSDSELAGLYRLADCLVYPSFYEGFGLPPLEAMRMGGLVVVSKTSALAEVCGDSAFYCQPDDPHSIAQAIESVLKLSSEERRLRQAKALEHACQFTWQRTAQAMLDTLLGKIASHTRPAVLSTQ